METEILKRAKETGFERVPKPELRRETAIKPREYVPLVGAFRRRSESEELHGLDMVEEPSIGIGLGVVKLVNDDDLKMRRRKGVECPRE